TINVPESEEWLDRKFPFPVRVLRNQSPKGFGANHNAAFRVARGSYFAVVNPDIRLNGFQMAELVGALQLPDAGVAGPIVTAPDGRVEDSARRFPTFFRLFTRKVLHRRDPDYVPSTEAMPVEWLAGMFLLFPSDVYRTLD